MAPGLLKIGFVGCGNHARVNLYPCLQYAPVRLTAVCASHKENARMAAKTFGAQTAYDSYTDMFQREKIDAVFVSVGAERHFEICSQALRRGLHVFVEKPAAKNLSQARKLLEISRKANRHVMVGFMKRFAPAYRMAKRVIGSKGFGPLSAVQMKLCVGPMDSGRSLLVEVGIHHLDLIRFIGDEVKSISVVKHDIAKSGVFSIAMALKLSCGAVGSMLISSGQSWDAHNERVEISGRRGFILIDNVVSFRHYNTGIAHPRPVPDHVFWEPNFTVPNRENQTLFLNGFCYEICHFAESILKGKRPQCDIEDFCRTMKSVESISAKTGWLQL